MTDTEKTIIDLNASQSVRSIGTDEFLQRTARTELLDKLKQYVRAAKNYRDNLKDAHDSLIKPRAHNGIIIAGPRGSGKTTFILNVFDEIKQNKIHDDYKKLKKLAILGPLDPTLLADNENLVILIITQIKKLIDKKYDGNHSDDRDHENWLKSLKDLAKGLRNLEHVGPQQKYGEEWEDAQYILEEGLSSARSDVDLEEAFHRFINNSLIYLNKSAFVITIDDVDTDFKKGWPILESLRKYLTTPQIIPVLSGDLNLYTKAVRSNQWEVFSSRQLKYDTKEAESIHQMVGHLEDQYLQKILKPENRIALESLAELKDNITIRRTEKADGPNDGNMEQAFSETVKELFEKGMGFQSAQSKIYTANLLEWPLRTILQILKLYDQAPDAFVTKQLADIFVGPLSRKSISLTDIRHADADRLQQLLVTLFLSHRDKIGTSLYHPTFLDDEDFTIAQMIITAMLNRKLLRDEDTHSMNSLFKSVIVASIYEELDKNRNPHSMDPFKYIQIGSSNDMMMVAYHYMAALYSKCETKQNLFRTDYSLIPIYRPRTPKSVTERINKLYGVAANNKGDNLESYYISDLKPHSSDELKPYLDSLDENERVPKAVVMTNMLEKNYGQIPKLALMQITRKDGTIANFLSITKVIALIADLVSDANMLPDADENKEPLETSTKRKLTEASDIRAIASYEVDYSSISKDVEDVNAENDEPDNDSEANDDYINQLSELTAEWLLSHKNKFKLNPLLWEKIWARYLNNCRKTASTIAKTKKLLGELLYLNTVAFLNAILVTELQEANVPDAQMKLPVTTDREFVQNFKKYQVLEDKETRCPSFTALVQCPLLWPYILTDAETSNVSKTVDDPFKEYIGKITSAKEGKNSLTIGNSSGKRIFLRDLYNAVLVMDKSAPTKPKEIDANKSG